MSIGYRDSSQVLPSWHSWGPSPDGQQRQQRQELWGLDTGCRTWPGNTGRSYCYVIIVTSQHSASPGLGEKLTQVTHLASGTSHQPAKQL